MPELAKNVVLDLNQKKLHINGTEFPWHISADGVQANNLGCSHELPSLTLTILCEDLEVRPQQEGHGD